MQSNLIDSVKGPIALITSDTVDLRITQDALDIMANCKARAMILGKKNIAPEFFDLKTGLLGEVMQKFVNYGFRVAIVGDFTDGSKNFQDFIFESNKTGMLLFLPSEDEAIRRLS
jgi:hypothetical protein